MGNVITGEELAQIEKRRHRMYHRKLIYIFIILLIILFIGATFYHYAEGWRYIDALYFSAATMTTVGYGDITPKTDIGKIFTIIFVFAGVGAALYGLSVIAAHFVDVREAFWLEKIGQIRIRHHTETFWEKIKNFFNYNPDKLVEEYDNSVNPKK